MILNGHTREPALTAMYVLPKLLSQHSVARGPVDSSPSELQFSRQLSCSSTAASTLSKSQAVHTYWRHTTPMHRL